ncbi:MAG: hypothetical protein NXI31_05620 [bacterium]|nr:hypothetical protein [bacterium]
MTETAPETAAAAPEASTSKQQRSVREWVGDMPRWKKISLIGAGGLLATGAVLMIINPGGGAEMASGAGGSGVDDPLRTSLLPGTNTGGNTETGNAAQGGEEPAAKGIFRLGFSFVVGFALGSFVRATMRFAAIALGFWLAMTLILAYYDLVVVNWQSIDDLWAHFMGAIEAEWASFQTFITGSLPAAALVATGFFVGFKRH